MKRINGRGLIVIGFVLASALTQSATVLAQATAANSATIAGHVIDPQGASLPGARVTLYARESTLRLTTTTDATGAYRFERLAPGEYLIEAEAERDEE